MNLSKLSIVKLPLIVGLIVLSSGAFAGGKPTGTQLYPITTVNGYAVYVTPTALQTTWDLYLKDTVTNQEVVNLDGSVSITNPRIHTGVGGYFSVMTPSGVCKVFKHGAKLGASDEAFGTDAGGAPIYREVYLMNDDGTVSSTSSEARYISSITCKAN